MHKLNLFRIFVLSLISNTNHLFLMKNFIIIGNIHHDIHTDVCVIYSVQEEIDITNVAEFNTIIPKHNNWVIPSTFLGKIIVTQRASEELSEEAMVELESLQKEEVKKLVLFGNFSFFEGKVSEKDEFQPFKTTPTQYGAILNQITGISFIASENDLEGIEYDSYIIPADYNGEIAISEEQLKNLLMLFPAQYKNNASIIPTFTVFKS